MDESLLLFQVSIPVFLLFSLIEYQQIPPFFGRSSIADLPFPQMCIDCTMARVKITECNNHTFERLKPEEVNANKIVADLLAQGNSVQGYSDSHWCAVCPYAATHGCKKEKIRGRGCELKLCDVCAMSVKEYYDGNLAGFIEDLVEHWKKSTGEEESLFVRPDAVLLTSKGGMLTHIRTSFGNLVGI